MATVSERPRRRTSSRRDETPLPVTIAPRTVVQVVAVVIGSLALVAFVYAARSILLEFVASRFGGLLDLSPRLAGGTRAALEFAEAQR